MDGIDRKLVPPAPLNNINVYHLSEAERRKMKIASLPGSLAESLDELAKDKLLLETLGETIYEAFTRAKWEEWDQFRIRVTDWELEHYLELA
jgi:glutamine synthetase